MLFVFFTLAPFLPSLLLQDGALSCPIQCHRSTKRSLLVMYEVSAADSSFDPFSMAKRPLKLRNLNIQSYFEPVQTRIPAPAFLRDSRIADFESKFGTKLRDPDELVSASSHVSVTSDIIHREFAPITRPEMHIVVPLGQNEAKPPPHWMCDLPSSTMHREKKVFMNEAVNPTLSSPQPSCCSCGRTLEFPFMGSLNYDICQPCLGMGKLPVQTTTLDFFKVEDSTSIGVGWSLEETNRLVTLVAENGDDWAAVASKMKTRTAAECLVHFMRVPMYDQYYVADPLSVPKGEIPEDGKLMPFMIAPDPIAAFVVFMNVLDRRLGSALADYAESRIAEILTTQSGVMLYDRIPDIIRMLLVFTGKRAGELAIEDGCQMIATMRDIMRLLENDVVSELRGLDASVRDTRKRADELIGSPEQ